MTRVALVPLVLLLVPSVAHAQTTRTAGAPPDEVAAEGARADRLFAEAHEALVRGNLRLAVERYAQAFELRPTFDIAGNLGNVEVALGRVADGAGHLRFALAHFPPSASPKARERLEERLAAARLRTATLDIVITPPHADARVWLDGAPLPADTLLSEVFVENGVHVVEVRAAGCPPSTRRLETRSGVVHQIEIPLPPPAPPLAPPAEIAPPAPPGVAQPPPPLPSSLPVFRASIAPRAPASLPIETAGEGGCSRWLCGRTPVPAYALGGGALVALGTSIAFSVTSHSATSDAHAIRSKQDQQMVTCHPPAAGPECAELDRLARRSHTFQGLAIAGYTVAGLAAASAVVYGFWPRRPLEKAEGPPRLSLTWGASFVGEELQLRALGEF